MGFMPVRACSEAVLNPLSLDDLKFGLRENLRALTPPPLFLKNGIRLFASGVPECSSGVLVLPPLGVWSYPQRELNCSSRARY